MIKTDRQYKEARAKCQESGEQLQRQRDNLQSRGYSEDEICCLTGCINRMMDQSQQAVELYRRLKSKDPTALQGLTLNRHLIGLRIYLGLSQSQLANLLGVPRTEVVREEKNEYPNLTMERYHQILGAMGVYHFPNYVLGEWSAANEVRGQLNEVVQQNKIPVIIG